MNLSATVQWSIDLQCAPCALRGGKAIFAAANAPEQATLHAFTPDGRELWSRAFEQAMISGLETSEALRETSEVLVTFSSADLLRGEGMVLALSEDGQEAWRWTGSVQKVSAPAVVDDLIYFVGLLVGLGADRG